MLLREVNRRWPRRSSQLPYDWPPYPISYASGVRADTHRIDNTHEPHTGRADRSIWSGSGCIAIHARPPSGSRGIRSALLDLRWLVHVMHRCLMYVASLTLRAFACLLAPGSLLALHYQRKREPSWWWNHWLICDVGTLHYLQSYGRLSCVPVSPLYFRAGVSSFLVLLAVGTRSWMHTIQLDFLSVCHITALP
jgi:hypothetical protein